MTNTLAHPTHKIGSDGCCDWCEVGQSNKEWQEPCRFAAGDTDVVSSNTENEAVQQGDRMMKWFEFDHLPPHLQTVSSLFFVTACGISENVEPGPERTAAFRKLLEAKDAAVRAAVHPGG